VSVTPKGLISAKYASDTDTTEYTSPADTKTIIDKFTATNNDASDRTLTVNIVPNGGTLGNDNLIMIATSIAAGATRDFSELQNQILNDGDSVSVVASVASMVIIRMSGRAST